MFHICRIVPHMRSSVTPAMRQNPTLGKATTKTTKALRAGISTKTQLSGPEQAIRRQARDVLAGTGGKRLMLGLSCSISQKVQDSHLQLVTDELSR